MPLSELHCHTSDGSNIRFKDSTLRPSDAIDYALSHDYKALAITDHESLSAHIKALNHFQKIKQKAIDKGEAFDLSLILGNEIYLIDEHDSQNTDQFHHFILLAKDAVGHKQLRLLSSRAWGRSYCFKGIDRPVTWYRDLEEIVGTNPGHLIASTACLGGQLPKMTLAGDTQGVLDFSHWCQSIFGIDNFYIELQCGITPEQIEFNQRILRFCKHFKFPWIITNDVHYLSIDKRTLHENFLNSEDGADREVGDFYENTYFKNEDAIYSRMDYLDPQDVTAAFFNMDRIVEMCKDADYGLFRDTIVPDRDLPALGLQFSIPYDPSEYPFLDHFYHSPHQQDLWLMQQIEQGLIRTKTVITHEVLERLDYELQQMWEIGEKKGCRISAYYNIVQLVIQIMWDDTKGGSLVGPARGSVGGWYIAYLMDIIQLNPLKWGTVPWRHLHSSRPDWPDVDIDSCASRRQQIFQATKDYFGADRCLNIITFKTESSKSAIQTAARGLGYDVDLAREISSLVPSVRGKTWTLDECLHGNEDNGFQPITEFVNKIKQLPGLLETAQEIEGLVSGRGVHASGFFIFKTQYTDYVSMMRAPNGTPVSCWDMSECEQCGALKIDFLTIEAEDKIYQCLMFLLRDSLIQWQGSLKATYDKYIHPDVLDYTTSEMWEMAADGKVVDLFQMMTDVGAPAIRRIRPKTLKELALTNSAMRLIGDENGSPIDRFLEFKEHPEHWYQEARDYGLTEDEIQVLEKQLAPNHFCSIEQEDMMNLVMDSKIAGFTMTEANKIRKAVAKKKRYLMEEAKELFFQKGFELGTRRIFLDYVWKYDIMPQAGYSFSRNHTLPYSAIALQEMNLFYHYPHIYWQCAVLTVNASADEENQNNDSTNYGKIAKAINSMQHQGVKIVLPDILLADYGFKPDRKNDQIIFGLKGISGIGDDLASLIVANRPYDSLGNFLSKVEIGDIAFLTLVKAGCFDTLLNEPREQIMTEALNLLAQRGAETKESLGLRNLKAVSNIAGFVPHHLEFAYRLNDFRAYIKRPEFVYEKDVALLDRVAQIFFESELIYLLKETVDYSYCDSGVLIYLNKFEKQYQKQIIPLKQWLMQPETLEAFNKAVLFNYTAEKREKYCQGSIPKWEMDSLCFYYTEHELAHVNNEMYGISDFFSLPEQPIVTGQYERSSKAPDGSMIMTTYDRYELYRIAGTVLDRDKTRHTVTLLTTTGVVNVKFYSGAFTNYNKQVSAILPDGTKKVIEKPWFTRGNKIMVAGIRRDDTFFPKKYKDSIYQHTVNLITDVYADGTMSLKNERSSAENYAKDTINNQ